MEIIPAILEEEWSEIAKKLGALSGKTEWVQIDVADGDFAGPSTWNKPDDLWSFETDIAIELHLMIARPWEHMSSWFRSPAKRFALHFEAFSEDIDNLDTTLQAISTNNKEVVLALNPETPISVVNAYISSIDGVLLLGVVPGRSGQEFLPETLSRISSLRAEYPDVTIAVDGGVDDTTIARVVRAGANRLISSSFVFSFNDPAEGIRVLTQAAQEGNGDT